PVGSAHHGDLDALAAHAGDAAGPFPFDGHAPLEREAELAEERDGGIEVLHHDADVVHAPDRQAVSLASRTVAAAAGNVPRSMIDRARRRPDCAAVEPRKPEWSARQTAVGLVG